MATGLILAILVIGVYSNGMKSLRKLEKTVEATWGDVEWRLAERNKYLPDFLETTKIYAPHTQTFQNHFNQMHSEMMTAIQEGDRHRLMRLANQFEGELLGFLAVIETIPELQTEEQFLRKHERLRDIENRIASDRDQYNKAVSRYNRFLEGVTGRLIGLKHSPHLTFELTEGLEPSETPEAVQSSP